MWSCCVLITRPHVIGICKKRLRNPTIGLILCADTSKDIAKYSILRDNKQLFAAKYLTYLPSEEDLKREIERQKEIFQLQHSEVK